MERKEKKCFFTQFPFPLKGKQKEAKLRHWIEDRPTDWLTDWLTESAITEVGRFFSPYVCHLVGWLQLFPRSRDRFLFYRLDFGKEKKEGNKRDTRLSKEEEELRGVNERIIHTFTIAFKKVELLLKYSGRRLKWPPRDRPFLVLISGWFYYLAGLFIRGSKFAFKSGHMKSLVPLSAVTLSGVHCID